MNTSTFKRCRAEKRLEQQAEGAKEFWDSAQAGLPSKEVFEDRNAATNWMSKPNGVLGGNAPVLLCETEFGAKQARRVLHAESGAQWLNSVLQNCQGEACCTRGRWATWERGRSVKSVIDWWRRLNWGLAAAKLIDENRPVSRRRTPCHVQSIGLWRATVQTEWRL